MMNIFFKSVKKHFEDFIKSKWSLLEPSLSIECDGVQHQNTLMLSSRFLHQDLQKKINSKRYWKHSAIFTIEKVHVDANIFSLSRHPKGIKHLIWVIAFIIYYSSQCKSNGNSNHKEPYKIIITVVLSPYKKIASPNKPLVTSYNVNSGLTIIDGHANKSEVFVFRREEVVKVLIHEIIHAMKLDAHFQGDTLSIKRFFGLPATYSLNVNESFTETYACLLNVAIATLLSQSSYRDFQSNLLKEQQFILMQGSRVAELLKIPIDTNGYLQPNTHYEETTNVIAYYILKAVVFANINVFVTFLLPPSCKVKMNSVQFIELLKKHIPKTTFDNRNNNFAEYSYNKNISMKMSSIDTLKLGH